MAGNTRGKLKEHLEGMHRNCNWIKTHCEQSLELLPDGYDKLEKSFGCLVEMTNQLDNFINKLYSNV